MSAKLDLVGKKFGKITVISFNSVKNYSTFFNCRCDCGNNKIMKGSYLTPGIVQSCGCLRKITAKLMGTTTKKHGKSTTRTYACWAAMKSRCTYEKHPQYNRYGGRGITICDKWLIFENFYDDMGDKPKTLSIERRDNNKGYYKENCYWGTKKQQQRNRECTLFVNWKGSHIALSEICEKLGINYQTAYARLADGMSIEKVLDTNKHSFFRENNPRNRYLTFRNETKRMIDWANQFGMKVSALSYRIRKGWDIKRALTTPVKIYN